MKPILVLYATREGYTERIADYVAAGLRRAGHAAKVHNAKGLGEPFALSSFSAAILAASVHLGRHEAEVESFAKKHCLELDRMPTAFISVSLSEAGAEDNAASPERRAQSTADVHRMFEDFVKRTGWHPGRTVPVAGALLYSKYNFLVLFAMKRIARTAGASTDTSRDHEFTDWQALDRFVSEFMSSLPSA